MAQYDNAVIQAPPAGPDINDTSFMTEYFQKLVTAILSGHYGADRPPNATDGMIFAKNVGGFPVLCMVSGAEDIPFVPHATPDDLTAGQLLKVGSFGLGASIDAGDLDTRTTSGFYFGYGGAHVSASAGVNPFPALDGPFALLVTNHGLGGAAEYVVQEATSITTGSPQKVVRTKTSDANGWTQWVAVGGNGIVPDFVLENRQASGVGGGTLNASGVNTMILNTEVRDVAGVVTLAANEFTVTEDCYIEYVFPIYSVSNAAIWLFNVTDGVVVPEDEQFGMNSFTREGTVNAQMAAHGWAFLESNHTYRIELDSTGGQSLTGQGNPSAYGGNERYGILKGWMR